MISLSLIQKQKKRKVTSGLADPRDLQEALVLVDRLLELKRTFRNCVFETVRSFVELLDFHQKRIERKVTVPETG